MEWGRPMDRFWDKVEKTEGCWEWNAATYATGYGAFWMDGRMRRAHRVAFELSGGEVPEGQMVLHSCDNRACANPEHLRAGTASDNMRDAAQRSLDRKGERAHYRKLSERDVQDIRALWGTG